MAKVLLVKELPNAAMNQPYQIKKEFEHTVCIWRVQVFYTQTRRLPGESRRATVGPGA